MIDIYMVSAVVLTVLIVVYVRLLALRLIVPARIRRARRYLSSHPAKAVRLLDSVLKLQRDHLEANWLLSDLYLKDRRFIMAQICLHDILKGGRFSRDISEREVRERLARCYQYCSEYRKALTQYHIMLHKEIFTLPGLTNAIRLNLEQSRFKEADELLREALSRFPDGGELHSLQAQLHYDRKQYKLAEQSLQSAEHYGYDAPDLHYLYGRLYFLHQQYDLALDRFQRLPAEYVKVHDIETFMGQCFYHLEDYRSAILSLEDLLSKSLHTRRFTAELMYMLGCAYEINDDTSRAIAIWRQTEKEFPYFKDVRKKLQFYEQIKTKEKIKLFLSLPFHDYVNAVSQLLQSLDYDIKDHLAENGKMLEYLCTSRKNMLFNLTYFICSRKTLPVSDQDLNRFRLWLSNYHAKTLIVLAPYFTDLALRFAERNRITLYTPEVLVDRDVL
jgi:tetratricopeptide (TPR) repeat protein